MGDRAKAWCLLIHAEACVSLLQCAVGVSSGFKHKSFQLSCERHLCNALVAGYRQETSSASGRAARRRGQETWTTEYGAEHEHVHELRQGLTRIHLSAQRKLLQWNRGCI